LDGLHAEVDCAGGAFVFANEVDLVGDFGGFPVAAFGVGSAGVLSGPEVDVLFVDAAPPIEEDGEGLGGLGDGPVELRAVVVAPAEFVPFERVGVQFFVLIDAGFDCGGDSGAVDTEGRDAKFDVGGFFFEPFVDSEDEVIDAFTAPVAFA